MKEIRVSRPVGVSSRDWEGEGLLSSYALSKKEWSCGYLEPETGPDKLIVRVTDLGKQNRVTDCYELSYEDKLG